MGDSMQKHPRCAAIFVTVLVFLIASLLIHTMSVSAEPVAPSSASRMLENAPLSVPSLQQIQWLTYSNKKNIYSLQYPSDWISIEYSDNYVRFLEEDPSPNGLAPLSYFSVLVISNPDQLQLDKWLSLHEPSNTTPVVVAIGGLQARELTVQNDIGIGSKVAYIQQGDLIYQVSLIVRQSQRNDLYAIFDQMLSSFNLIISTSPSREPIHRALQSPLSPAQPSANYDRQAVYNYASNYWWRPVDDCIYYYCTVQPSCTSYGSCSNGHNDCVHFVSHSMKAGGIDDGHIVNADTLASWFQSSGNGNFVSSQSSLNAGDVILYSWDGGPLWDHSAIVIGNNGGGDVRIAEHSFNYGGSWDQWNLPWNNYAGSPTKFGFVIVGGGSSGNPPSAPSNPNPADYQTLSRTNNTTLYWNTNGTSCDIRIWGGAFGDHTFTGQSCSSFFLGSQYGGAFQWQVTARNSYGSTQGPTWHFYVRPYAPTNLNASSASQTQINLSWTRSSDDPGSVDAYNIYYSNGNYISQVSAGTTSTSVGNLTCGTSYSFYVRAVRQGVESDNSNTASANTQSCGGPPTTPSNPNPNDGATVDRTNDNTFYWNTNGTSCNIHIWGGPGIDTTQTGISCSSFHWGSQWPGTYQWQVVAINGYGSTVGPTWHLNIRPSAPTNLNASTGSQTQINLSWTKSSDDPGSVDSYRVYFGNGTYIASVSAGTTTYSVNNLTCGTSYSFYVTAVRQGIESNASNTASASTQSCPPACTPSTVPPAVTLLSPPDGGIVGTTTPTLDWADISSSYCVDYFNILINENGGSQVDTAWPTASQYSVPSGKLTWGKSYTWYVWAHNSLGFGNGSAWSFGVGVAPNPPTLSSPSNGTILNRSDSVTLSWNTSTGATEYYARIFGGPSIDLNSGWTSNTFWSLGSQWGGNYQWEVKARNSYGESAYSPIWNLTIKYGAPSNLATSVASQSQINLSWSSSADAPGNIDGYRVYRNGSAINTVGSSTTSYNDIGLNCNTSYSYTVKAYKGSAESDASNTANATTSGCIPDPPTLISPSNNAALNNRTVNFTWQSPNSQNQNGYTFRLSASANPDTQPWIVDTGLGNSYTTYTNTFSADGTYYWHMRTWNTSGQASSWVSRSFVVDTGLPTAVFIYPIQDGYVNTNQATVVVSPSDSQTNVTQVQFFAGYNNGSSWGWWDSFVDTNPADGWTWTWNATNVSDQPMAFWVYVWDRAGNLGNNSIGNVRLDRTPPTSSVSSLPAESPVNLTVAWSGSDNLAGIATYDVQYQDGSSGTWTDWQTNVSSTSATFTGVGNHTYYFRSRARDNAGNVEAWPATADAQTTIPCYTLTTTINPGGVGTISSSPQPNCGTQYAMGTNVTLTATANAEYTFQSWSGNASGSTNPTTIVISTTNNVIAKFNVGNDDFDSAKVISATPYSDSENTTNATTASDDPGYNCGNGSVGSASVWYRFTPSINGQLSANTIGSGYDTMLAVWRGTRGSLTSVACDDDSGGNYTSSLSTDLTAGTTYYIEVANFHFGGYSGGPLTLSVNFTPCYTLTTNVNPSSSGSVSASPAPNCNTGTRYTSGTSVTLTAISNTGYAFDNWSGDVSGASNPVTITLTSNKVITANLRTSPALANSAWPMFLHDLRHTGQSSYNGPSWPNLKWNFDTGVLVYSAPMIASDGTIILGAAQGTVYAFNPDGTVKWSYNTGQYIEYASAAIAADGTIYQCTDGGMYAFNANGTLKWNVAYGRLSNPAIGSDGTIYAIHSYSGLAAINSNGTLKWVYPSDGVVLNSSPAIAPDGTIYFGDWRNKLYAINPDGTSKWTYTVDGWIESSPAIGADGTIYVTSDSGTLYAINPNGSLKWNRAGNGTPTIAMDGTIHTGSFAYDTNGNLVWHASDGGMFLAIGANGIGYGGYGTKMYATAPDGTVLWAYPTGGGFHSPGPAIGADGTLYFGSDDGKLYALTQGTMPSPTTTITSSVNPSVVGQSVTFTATVTMGPPAVGSPTGTVTFKDGTTTLGTATLISGTATFSISALALGSHSITAVYSGDSHFASSTSVPLIQNVTQSDLIVESISYSPTNISVGQPVTFTIRIKNQGTADISSFFWLGFYIDYQPSGCNDANNIYAVYSLAAGAALNADFTYPGSISAAGLHNLYGFVDAFCQIDESNEDNNLLGPISITVNKGTTTSTIATSDRPSVFGQSVTLTATVTPVAPGYGTPTGMVSFRDVTTTLGTGTLSGGIATFNTSSLAVGSHDITATYGGDTNFNGSTSATLTQVVNKANTTTNIISSPNPSVIGQPVTFTATITAVAPGTGTATGTVTFKDGATTLGTGTCNGGQAVFTTSALLVGNRSITAVYSGDTSFNPSTSSALTQVVNKANTTTTLSSSANPSVVGQSVTFTATVAVAAPGSGLPAGSVTFKEGATTLGTGTLSGGSATFSTTSLALGSHSITATYDGDTNFNVSTSATLSQVVNKANTTTSVSSSVNPATLGQSITFTATVSVTSPGSGVPTGTVTFKDGTTTIGTGTLSGGTATFITSSLASGSHDITAVYVGDANFITSTSSTLTQVVNKASTATTISSSANPSVFGQSVTFTVTVTVVAPGSGTPTGTVTFKDGTATLGSSTLSGGIATFTLSSLALGSHSITAVYSGDTSFATSTSSTLTQGVNKASTLTGLNSSANPSLVGQSVTFTATVSVVSPGSGTPTGSITFKDGATTLGTGMLSGYTATFTISSLALGSHSVTAIYGGDTNFDTSTSAILTQVVNKANTVTTVSSSANPSVVGQSVTFTATVTVTAPGAGTPMGSVTFKDGATTLGTGTLSSGIATFNIFSLTLGSHDITATYAGDTNFNTSTSAILTQVVNKANTTTTITSSPNPSLVGQSVTFTATVSATAPGSGIPTGSITFKDGTTTIGTSTLAGGTATFTTSALSKGSHSITAVYGGDTNYNTNTSSILNQTVGNANTTTTISSAPNPSVFGQTVTFTATVTAAPPATGTPTGNVTLKDGTTSIGTATLSSGKATFTISTLVVGGNSITATYDGDTEFNGSTSSILTQTVNKASTTTTLNVSANPSLVGQSLTFTATVTVVAPGVGTPTGTVTFKDGATTLGTGTISGNAATFTTSSLTLGSHSITAVYSGDSNFNTSSSATLIQVVNQAGTTTIVTSSANPSVIGQTVTFTATVSVSAPGSGTPTGTITFKDGATTLGTGTLSGGTATFSINSLVIGSHTITAVYAGDTNFAGSTSSTLTQVVNKASTLTTLSASANPSVVGQSVTFTATVSVVAPGTGVPSGTITFKDGVTTLGTGTLSNGTATLSTSLLVIGSHTITAEYGGNTNFDPSTSTGFSQTVNKASTTTALESSINPSTVGQSITFTATVTVTAPGNATLTGSVTFKDGSTTIGTSTLSGGKAILATSTLTAGSHSITAVYGGDTNLNGSTSAVLTQMVKQASNTTVSSTVNPSVFGQSVMFTATVSSVPPGNGTPGGTVTFKDGVNILGTANLSGGQTTFTAPSLSTGAHTISVVYGGDTNFNGSTSTTYSQTVNKASTTIALTNSVNSSVYGQSIIFTATVTVVLPGNGTPSGTMTFKDGATTLGTGSLSAGKATFTISTLGAGTHYITAVYAGDANFDTSTSGTLTQTINQATTSVTISSSSNPSGKGQPLALTANVTILPAGGGTATGTVTFRDGASILGTGSLSGGKATFTTSTLTMGNHSISATYDGDTNCITSTSSILTQVINEGNRLFLPFITR